ncbi:hypothetical protein AMTRI_Chr12g270740 [Amborella trichopoda]
MREKRGQSAQAWFKSHIPHRMTTRSSSRALTVWNKKNQTPEIAIIIPDDSEEVIPLAIHRGVERIIAPTMQGEPREGPNPVIASNSRQVIHPFDWHTHRGLVMAYVRLPFPDQVKRLNRHNSDICTMEIGRDLLRATYQLFSHALFSELAMFPFFVKKLMKNLTDFNVPCTGLFGKKMETIVHWAREVLEIEDLVSTKKNPSIALLLKTPFLTLIYVGSFRGDSKRS